MAKVGRKSKYGDFVDRKGLVLVRGWARDGLTDVQIAKNIGITTSTLYEWKNKYPDFSEALKESKEVADFEVESALFKKAKMGDVTAQIFWLKNRKPKQWRDKVSFVDETQLAKLDEMVATIEKVRAEDPDE
jgi:transposase-like protein